MVQSRVEERGLCNVRQIGFHASNSTTLHCTRLTDHVPLNLNGNKYTAAVFVDIEKPLILHGTLVCYIDHLDRDF
jgi:hypothetical protein